MRTVTKVCFFLVMLMSVSACRQQLKTDAYINYVKGNDNGLKRSIEVDGWQYSFQYKPYDYIVLMESRGDLKSFDVKKRLAELKGTAWFNISFKRTDGTVTPLKFNVSTLDEYNERLDYYLNEAAKDIKLAYGADTLLPVSYLFENNYNLTPQETMIVGFYLPKTDDHPQRDMQLSYNDHMFKNGIIKATYSKAVLNNIPNLVY